MPINNRGLSGQPVLPYTDNRTYQGSDVFIDLTFLDHTGAVAIPSSVSWALNDMSNAVNMIPLSTFVPTSYTYTLQLPASSMVMTHQWQGSQICQLNMTATLSDGSQVQTIIVIELCAIQTPFNGS